jgi:hypothetical protein
LIPSCGIDLQSRLIVNLQSSTFLSPNSWLLASDAWLPLFIPPFLRIHANKALRNRPARSLEILDQHRVGRVRTTREGEAARRVSLRFSLINCPGVISIRLRGEARDLPIT